MSTKAELEEEVARLTAENETLRRHLEEGPTTGPRREMPTDPSFGLSEGERADLEQTGRATSPFTGETREGTPEDFHTVTDAESEPDDADDAAEPEPTERGDR